MIISYKVRNLLLQMNDNIFLHLLYGPYLVVFKNNNLCSMEDNELYSKKKPWKFLALFRGLIQSVLRIKACASWGIMNHIVQFPQCKRMPTFSDTFL